jgi:hypothetical protein
VNNKDIFEAVLHAQAIVDKLRGALNRDRSAPELNTDEEKSVAEHLELLRWHCRGISG